MFHLKSPRKSGCYKRGKTKTGSDFNYCSKVEPFNGSGENQPTSGENFPN